jgi:hypothetical protein
VDKKNRIVKWSKNGLMLELAAMPTDLVRAFFLGRGFSPEDAGLIAKTGCIFRSAMGNSGNKTTDPAIVIELSKWQVITKQGKQSPRTREDWVSIWNKKKVSDDAKVAFHWALYPSKQTYQSTDYNWGMISFALPPGSKFDLQIRWYRNGDLQTKRLNNLECGK